MTNIRIFVIRHLDRFVIHYCFLLKFLGKRGRIAVLEKSKERRGDSAMATMVELIERARREVYLEPEMVAQMLPHKYPALLVESATIFLGREKENSAIRVKTCFNSEFLNAYHEGHFPDRPVVMNGFLDDAVAQAIVLLATWLMFEEERANVKKAVLMREKRVKYLKPVGVDDSVVIVARIVRRKGSLVVGSAEMFVDEEVVCRVSKITGVYALFMGAGDE